MMDQTFDGSLMERPESMKTPSPRKWSVFGYFGEVATWALTASKKKKLYLLTSAVSWSFHSKLE